MLDFEEMQENQCVTQFNFIVTELDLALTFCKRALAASAITTADRNRKHAEDAYASALHFAKTTKLTAKMVSEINDRERQLKDLLRQLDNAR